MEGDTPRIKDPRPWFALLLGSYVICGLAFLGFGRTPWQAGLTVATAMVVDFLLDRLLRGRGGFPWSGMITGFGLCLLLDCGSNLWLPMLPALLAIGSKHLFTVNGRHVYNPALFGLIVGSFLNAAIYRLPREGMTLGSPKRSLCPSCGRQVRARENIPVLSWLWLRGRCAAYISSPSSV